MDLPVKGDRIEVVHCDDVYDPLAPGTTGTVLRVQKLWDDNHQISVEWDDRKRNLSLVVPPDTYRIIERVMD